ncbi:MAG: toll/interleukin-1 receptor domain-containing protein [Chlorobiales bacterium]|nr:toll/interleukin-1 receptor domain-containing protein [Chlorobiales bacterium]
MKTRVFISHFHEDRAAYSALCIALDNLGVSRWDVSRLALGRPLADGLCDAIEQCNLCVFIATSRSLESKWCLAEIGAFWGAGKRVIIYLADSAVDESDLPPQFRGNLWTDDAKRVMEAIKESDMSSVQETKDGYSVKLGGLQITVSMGRVEEYECNASNRLVALPANEFFDDECIHDSNSALGAFMQRHFGDHIPAIQTLVSDQLAGKPSEDVEKTPGKSAKSYGIGACVYLEKPLSIDLRVAMIAVTTQRKDVGLRAGASYIFSVAEELHRIMANHRLTHLLIPVIGSGHGGLREEVSLITMLIAFAELSSRLSSRVFRDINIVVYKRDAFTEPSIAPVTILRALNFASRYLR